MGRNGTAEGTTLRGKFCARPFFFFVVVVVVVVVVFFSAASYEAVERSAPQRVAHTLPISLRTSVTRALRSLGSNGSRVHGSGQFLCWRHYTSVLPVTRRAVAWLHRGVHRCPSRRPFSPALAVAVILVRAWCYIAARRIVASE